MRLFGRNLVTLLLIAVMAMSAVSSPALRHRHADGDKSHQHGVATVEHHSHDTEATTAKHSHEDRSNHSAQLPVEHLHVFCFALQSSLPVPAPERSESPRSSASTEQWVPLISEVTLSDASQFGSLISAFDLLIPTELPPRLPARPEVRPPHESAVALLCDTARHERSGVLVI